MIFFLIPFFLYILTISFTSTYLVVFFAPPSIIPLIYICLLFTVFLIANKVRFSYHVKITTIYLIVVFFLVVIDFFLYGSMEIWYLYMFTSFAVYLVFFLGISSHQGDLIKFLHIYAYMIIIGSLFAFGYEYFQLIYQGISYDQLANKASSHYKSIGINQVGYRPLGLFGQYTINSILPILAYIAVDCTGKLNIDTNRKPVLNYMKVLLFLSVLIIVLIAGSGIGYIIFVTYVSYLLLKKSAGFIVAIFLISFSLLFFFPNGLGIEKISVDNILWNIDILIKGFSDYQDLDLVELFLGTDPKKNVGNIDTALTIVLNKSGIIGLLLMIFFYTWVIRAIDKEAKVFVYFMLLGSMHYPVLSNQATHILFALIMAVSWKLSIKKSVKLTPI